MSEVQSQSPAEAIAGTVGSSGADKDALITRLDALLEQYLHTLDEYEKLMQQLSKQLSSGFFSLTQANFHNRSGVHYGQDSYDERVQATRRITVNEDKEAKLHFLAISTLPESASKTAESKEEYPEQPGNEPEDPIVKDGFNENPPDELEKDINAGAEDSSDAPKPIIADPIRMFGILVPPALRSAQASFKDVIEGPVVRLAAVTGELRTLEREIGRARKGIRKARAGGDV